MVAFNFKKDFAPKIKSGVKRSTIRKTRRCNVGDTMQLYTGMRTKNCEKIINDVVCVGVAHVEIKGYYGGYTYWGVSGKSEITEKLHEQEGFESYMDMMNFFENHYGLPFEGWLHTWEEIKEGER